MAYTEPTLPDEVDYRVAATLRTVTVADTGNVVTNGTNLQTALDDAQFGDKIVLTAGATYQGLFTLKVPTGTLVNGADDNWVTITTSSASLPAAGTQVALSDAAHMPTLTMSNGASSTAFLLSPSVNATHHYRFVGLRFLAPQINGFSTLIFIGPPVAADRTTGVNYSNHISFERCIVTADHDWGCQIGIYGLGDDFRYVDSYFTNIYSPGTGEPKCIAMHFQSRRILIENSRLEGLGENVGIGFDSFGGPTITTGFEYEIPTDITIYRNYFNRPLTWCRNHSSFQAVCQTSGTGTVSSSGTTITFSTSQTGLSGKYIRGATSGNMAHITSGSGTTYTVAWVVGSSFSAGESWRYDVSFNLAKNLLEFKAGSRILIDSNVFQNGWLDQQSFALQIGGRSFGWNSDITITNNKFIDCTGMALSLGDCSSGSGFGASPYVLNRIRVSNNLWQNLSSDTAELLGAINQGMTLKVNSNGYYGQGLTGYTIQAASTTGSNVLFSSDLAGNPGMFPPWSDGWEIRRGSGVGTIIAGSQSVNGTTCRVNIDSEFPSTSTSPQWAYEWFMGPVGLCNQPMPTPDSWLFEHNTFVGPDSNIAYMPQMGYDDQTPNPIVPMTNFVWRNNMMYSGTGGGLYYQDHGAGRFALTAFMDAPTLVWDKNVYFGPIVGYESFYTPSPTLSDDGVSFTGGFGGGKRTAIHTPDETGSTSGGSVGFANYAGGDFSLTGVYATAATDGTMIGATVAALADTWTNVIAGVQDGGGGGGGPTAGALVFTGGATVLGFAMIPSTP